LLQTFGILLALHSNGRQITQCRANQALNAAITAQRFFRQARIGQKYRHTLLACRMQQVRP
jgi:hypothetical protein